jgi:hypothetical protein
MIIKKQFFHLDIIKKLYNFLSKFIYSLIILIFNKKIIFIISNFIKHLLKRKISLKINLNFLEIHKY